MVVGCTRKTSATSTIVRTPLRVSLRSAQIRFTAPPPDVVIQILPERLKRRPDTRLLFQIFTRADVRPHIKCRNCSESDLKSKANQQYLTAVAIELVSRRSAGHWRGRDPHQCSALGISLSRNR